MHREIIGVMGLTTELIGVFLMVSSNIIRTKLPQLFFVRSKILSFCAFALWVVSVCVAFMVTHSSRHSQNWQWILWGSGVFVATLFLPGLIIIADRFARPRGQPENYNNIRTLNIIALTILAIGFCLQSLSVVLPSYHLPNP